MDKNARKHSGAADVEVISSHAEHDAHALGHESKRAHSASSSATPPGKQKSGQHAHGNAGAADIKKSAAPVKLAGGLEKQASHCKT